MGEGKGEEEDRRLFQRVDILFTIRLFSRSFLRKKEFLKIIQRHSQNPYQGGAQAELKVGAKGKRVRSRSGKAGYARIFHKGRHFSRKGLG